MVGTGSGLPDAGQGRDHGQVRQGLARMRPGKEGSDSSVRSARSQAGTPRGRAPTPGGRDRAPTRSRETGAQGPGPQVLPAGALKALQRVRATSGEV